MKKLFFRALEAHDKLPLPVLERMLRHSLRGLCVALCLHRVQLDGGPLHGASEMMIPASELDRLLELLSLADGQGFPLLVSFDDGYADAAEYVRSRRARFPNIEWLLFVCPEKLQKRSGFRWDVASEDVFGPPHSVSTENQRPELAGVADRADCRLLTIQACRALQQEKIQLGNHTNCHFKHSDLPLEASRQDIFESRTQFEELFGKTEHFAFPFGTPIREFRDEHVSLVREAGYSWIWSTEPRPYQPSERVPGALLPRFPVFGSWPATKYAAFIAASALRFRLRSLRRRASLAQRFPKGERKWPFFAHFVA